MAKQAPTSEERAADRIWIRLSEGRNNYREVIVKEIRAAVAAERERAAKVDPWSADCIACGAPRAEGCEGGDSKDHGRRGEAVSEDSR